MGHDEPQGGVELVGAAQPGGGAADAAVEHVPFVHAERAQQFLLGGEPPVERRPETPACRATSDRLSLVWPLRASTSAVAFRMRLREDVSSSSGTASLPAGAWLTCTGLQVEADVSRGLTIREAGVFTKFCQSVTLCSCPTNGSARTTSPRGSSGDRPSTPGPDLRRTAGTPGLSWHPPVPSVFDGTEPGFWALTRRADIVQASLHPELFSSANGIALDPMPADLQRIATFFLMMDPPQHTLYRRLISSAFTPSCRPDRGTGPQERRRGRRRTRGCRWWTSSPPVRPGCR